MSIRFSVFSIKGGVGKSTIAYQLAKELSKRYRVTLVDRDYTNTVSRYYGLRTGLINSLVDGVEGPYLAEDGNLRVISLVSFQPSSIPSAEELANFYFPLLKDSDILITDNPPGVDEISKLELKAYYLSARELRCYCLWVTTPGISLDLTLREMNDVARALTSAVPSMDLRLLSLIVNMVKEGTKLPELPLPHITIPFYRDLLFKGFHSVEIKEIKEVADLAEGVIRNAVPEERRSTGGGVGRFEFKLTLALNSNT
ncbi:ParA family protein [Metallosphaera tengchongensis]|uniref:ParA family protein n=1 Tax=Metallosphaera tengchongensis TaxID=1532350 RepID=A0A6N0NUJ2_9CREN|nr:ParA family protein [Metallosphaera tengchongensis]QKR00392.1 ParA family protein [Metallosphaera tengchongensis]